MKNQPNKATVKDGRAQATKWLIDKGTHHMTAPILADRLVEYSDQQNAELLAWKESAMRELNALDLQSLGRKLGIGLGQSVSENLHAKIDGLLERVKELDGRKGIGAQEARSLVSQMLGDEISFSRFVELINEGGKQ